jgi:hypothetical protein
MNLRPWRLNNMELPVPGLIDGERDGIYVFTYRWAVATYMRHHDGAVLNSARELVGV